jgi:hypothetical protein
VETENNTSDENQSASDAGQRVEDARQAVLSSAQGVLARAKPILVSPQTAWPSLKRETESIESFYKTYLTYLIPITPVCTFVGAAIVSGAPFFASVVMMVVSLVIGFLVPFLAAVVCEKVAPMCEGEVSRADALRLVGYSATPGYLAGVFSLIPVFGLIGSLIGLYSIYLFYLGVPVMTSVPQKQVIKFMAIVIVSWIAISIVLGIFAAMFAFGGMAGGAVAGM